MLVALIFNIEYQLLALRKKLIDNGEIYKIELDIIFELNKELEKIGKITNFVLGLYKSFCETNKDEKVCSEYHDKLWYSTISYDISDYHKLIDSLDNELLEKLSLNYKIA